MSLPRARWIWRGAAVALSLALVAAVFARGSSEIRAASPQPLYWTSEKLEPDTIASAWLLQRFVAPGCSIRLLPRGEQSSAGTPFDLPLVELTRNRTQSTYHIIRATSGVSDPRAIAIERLVDALEIPGWKTPPSGEAAAFGEAIRARIAAASSPEDALRSGFVLMDELYATIRPLQESRP